MIDYILMEQIQQLNPYVNEKLISHISSGQAGKFESYKDMNLISFDWLDVSNNAVKPDKITICQLNEHLFFIVEDENTINRLKRIVKNRDESDKSLYSFFSEMLKPDMEQMQNLEERITDMEDVLLKDNQTDYTIGIISFRKELLRLKRYYEQIKQIFEETLENENQLITKDDLKYFRMLDKKVDQLLAHIINLRDYITQVREAYQAQIDIEQNKLMKTFTVITSIFLPLTLIVGWYGMNLRMPEFEWDFGYPFVIILSVVAAILLIIYFKRKKWFK